jgi:predicted Zn-dependent peptidase
MLPRYVRATAAALLGWATVLSAADKPPPATGVKIPPHQRFTLPNGVKLVLVPRHDVPLIAFDAVIRGGARLDPESRAGVATLTAELLTHGAGRRDAYAFADAVEDAGGNLDADAGVEAITVHGQFLARDSNLMLELLADAILRPRFDAAELDKLRSRRIELIKAAKDSEPQSVIANYGRALLFAGHPFAMPVGGSEASLERIRREDVLAYYRDHFGADRLTLVIAGDFDPAALRAAVARAFGGMPKAAVAPPPLQSPRPVTGRRVWLVDAAGSSQTYFWIGNVGVPRRYPARAALDIANTAFGGSFGSMLMKALRTETGLTYSVSAHFNRLNVPAEFSISSFTQTASTQQAVTLALATLSRLHGDGVDAAEIASARSYILGQYPLRFETATDWASALADLDLFDLPEGYIDDYGPALARVNAADTQSVIAQAFPRAEDVDIVLIGDAAKIREVAAGLGPVTETQLERPDYAVTAARP